jgi:hypothetical protein
MEWHFPSAVNTSPAFSKFSLFSFLLFPRRAITGRMPRLICLLLLLTSALGAAEPKPLEQAHAHNDYEHKRPLRDALDQGFANVEADIWLVDGKLLVAHDAKNVRTERTLAALYLDPLRQRIQANAGSVYRKGPPVVLLVDVKSEAEATYSALDAVLAHYADILTAFRGTTMERKAVTVIVSGNRAPKTMAEQPLRYAAIDGRAGDLEANPPAALVPWISENWQKVFKWRWEGTIPAADATALRDFVQRAHAQGRKVRFWNTPDRPDAWTLLLDAGVDVIGTDDLAGLAKYFRQRGAR